MKKENIIVYFSLGVKIVTLIAIVISLLINLGVIK